MNPIRVLIVASDPLARAGLAAWLSGDELCQIVGLVDAQGDWQEEATLYQADVVLYDGGWQSGVDWFEVGEAHLPVVALAPDNESAVEAWSAGVRGVVSRDSNAETILSALMAAAHRLLTIEPHLLPLRAAGTPPPPADPLTAREMHVLSLLAEGLTNKAIAQRLGISDHTVKFHVNAVLSKLGAQSRTEAVVRAARLGWLPL